MQINQATTQGTTAGTNGIGPEPTSEELRAAAAATTAARLTSSSVRTQDVRSWRGSGDARIVLPRGESHGWIGRVVASLQSRIVRTEVASVQRQAALTPSSAAFAESAPVWLRGLTSVSQRLHEVIATMKARLTPVDPDVAALKDVTAAVHARFAAQASDKEAFTALLHTAFGDSFDSAKAETIRQQALAGDFSWAPKVELATSASLADTSGMQAEGVARGAYAAETDTIYISRELLRADPAEAERILMEEMGHGIDARINTTDTVGDEGELFSRLMHGDKLSAADLQSLRADNDSGVVNVNGRNVAVEYGWFSKAFKAVTHAITSGIKAVVSAVVNGVVDTLKAAVNVAVGLVTLDFDRVKQGLQAGFTAMVDTAKEIHKAVKDTAKAIHKATKEAFKALMQSKLFAVVLMICRFIPIPIVQLVVRVIDLVRAAYMVYQGIKNKSLSAVLGGVASLAGGASNLAGALGASASTVSTISTVASAASKLSMAYNAVANKDLGSALSLLGGSVDTGSSPTLSTLATVGGYVQQGMAIRSAVRSGDTLGALGGVLGMAGSAVGDKTETGQTIANVNEVVTGLSALNEVRKGNLDAAQSLAKGMTSAQEATKTADAISARVRADARAEEMAAEQAEEQATEQAPQQATHPVADDAVEDDVAIDAADSADAADADDLGESAATEAGLAASEPAPSPSVTVGKGDTLIEIAQAQYGDQWRAGLTQLMLDNNLKLNQWGSPILREGRSLVVNDISGKSEQELASMSRTGSRIVSGNSKGLQIRADLEERARAAAIEKIQSLTRSTQADKDADPDYALVRDSNAKLAAYVTPTTTASPRGSFTADYDSVVGLYSDLKTYARNGVDDFALSDGIGVKTGVASVVHAASEIGFTMIDAGLGFGRIGAAAYDSYQGGTLWADTQQHVIDPTAKFAGDMFKSDVVRVSVGASLPDKSADVKAMIGTDRIGVQYKVAGPADSVNRVTYRWGDNQLRDEMIVEKNFYKFNLLPSGNVGGVPVSVDVVPGARLNLSGNRVATPSMNFDLNIAPNLIPYKLKATVELRKSGS